MLGLLADRSTVGGKGCNRLQYHRRAFFSLCFLYDARQSGIQGSIMLLALVALYLIFSVLIGIVASRRVHSASDYITAGRSLPMPVVMAMVFATWFGAETVLGISATFLDEGFRGLISDPLGASLCLVLFGLVFA